MTAREHEEDLRSLNRKWEEITDVPETPRSVMNVIEHSLGSQRKAEVYTNRLLRYFLDPEEPHGMETEFLKAFLEGLPDECGFDEDTYDLSNVEVDDQVIVSKTVEEDGHEEKVSTGEVDLVIESPNEWFVLIELKFSAGENNLRGEGLSQTENYYDASHIDGNPTEEYESGQYYLYLHQHDKPSAEEDEFSNWTWKDLIDGVLEKFIVENSPRYPQRTVAQLREFVDDLQEISGMTERQESEREKIELYLEHYDAIKDVTDTFDERWGEFTDEWANRLAERLRGDDVVRYLEPEGVTSNKTAVVELNDEDATTWVFRAKSSQWAYLFKKGWWRRTDNLNKINDRPSDDGNDVRVGFHHHLGKNSRENAIRDNELIFYFRNTGSNDREFKDTFEQEFYSRDEELASSFPEVAEITGNKLNMSEAVYDIRVDAHDDFFEAYIAALQRAFEDHVVENERLVSLLDDACEDAIDEVYR
jgi:hypothetical protein